MSNILKTYVDFQRQQFELAERRRRAAIHAGERAFLLAMQIPQTVYGEVFRTSAKYLDKFSTMFSLSHEEHNRLGWEYIRRISELAEPRKRVANEPELTPFERAVSATHTLEFADKPTVHTRVATPEDAEMVRQLFINSPDGDRRMRFFGTIKPELAATDAIKYSTLGGHTTGRDFIALTGGDDDEPERAVGFAGYAVSTYGPERMALPHILVAKDYQGARTEDGRSVAKQIFLDALVAAEYDPDAPDGLFVETLPDNVPVNKFLDRVLEEDEFDIAKRTRYYEDGTLNTKVVFADTLSNS